jgi:hypothetical protein
VTHHGRPGGVVRERLALLALLIASPAIVGASVVIVLWLTQEWSSRYHAIVGGFGFGLWLSAKLWRAFFRYYKYNHNTLDPIIEEDDQK